MGNRYRLYQHNSLKDLLAEHLSILVPNNPIEKNRVLLLQNKHMQQWLSLQVSRLHGVCFNLHYDFPERVVRQMFQDFEGLTDFLTQKKLIFQDDLYFVVLREMELLMKAGEKNQILSYISKSQYAPMLEKRKTHIAKEISRCLYRYAEHGDEMLHDLALEKNDRYRLQALLYDNIFTNGCYTHLYEVMRRIMKEKLSYKGHMKQINIFGSAFLTPLFQEFFYYLSEEALEVHQFLFVSSHHYQHPMSEAVATVPSYPWTLPLRNTFRIFKQKNVKPTGQGAPPLSPPSNMLSVLKKALLEQSTQRLKMKSDETFQVLNIPTPKREVEVLRDKILHMLDREPSLKLTDIAILAPDINDYKVFISQVFTSTEDPRLFLPHNIVDIRSSSQSRLIDGFFRLMDLCFSRFEVGKLLALFSNPYLLNAHGLTKNDLEVMKTVIKKYHVKWAVSTAQKNELELGGHPLFTFEHAFEQIYKLIVTGRDFNDELYIDSQTRTSLSVWMEILYGLQTDIKRLQHQKKTIENWASDLSSLVDKYFAKSYQLDEEKMDFALLYQIIGELHQIHQDLDFSNIQRYADTTYGFTHIMDFVQQSLERGGKRKGHYSSTGVTCSSISPFRAIPFKVIAVLGLNEGVFSQSKKEDVFLYESPNTSMPLAKREHNEQFSFFETIFSAENCLILSYQGYQLTNGKYKAPSSVIEHLLQSLSDDCIVEHGGKDLSNVNELMTQWVQKVHLMAFHESHFLKDSPILSFNAHAYSLLTTVTSSETLPELSQTRIPLLEVSLDDVAEFLHSPFKSYYLKNISLKLFDENEAELEESDESLDISILNKTMVMKKVGQLLFDEDLSDDVKKVTQETIAYYTETGLLSPLREQVEKQESNIIEELQRLQEELRTTYEKFKPHRLLFDGKKDSLSQVVIDGTKIFAQFPELRVCGDEALFVTAHVSKPDAPWYFLASLYLMANDFIDIRCVYLLEPKETHRIEYSKEDAKAKWSIILKLYEANLNTPLPLYYDLANEIIKAWKTLEKKGEVSDDVKRQKAEETMESYFAKHDDAYTRSIVKHDSYGKRYYEETQGRNETLKFDETLLHLLEGVFRPLNEYRESDE